MKRLAVIFCCTLAVALSAATNDVAALVPADARAIMKAFGERAATSKTAFMEFTQERGLKLFSEPLKTEGAMLVAQPGLIRWETIAPYQTIMLGDKKNVAQFEFNDGKWEKLKLGFPEALKRATDQMAAMNQGNMDAMLKDFEITATTGNETVLKMVPKNETVRGVMASMEIHLTPDLAATREVVMNEPNGDFTRITFRAEKYNVEFPAGTFDQTKPLPIADVKAAVNHAP
jgi:outer membrane lipoprotein-sorting protein